MTGWMQECATRGRVYSVTERPRDDRTQKRQGEDKKLEKIKDALVSKVEFRSFAV